MKNILSHKITQIITITIILLSAYIIIYPPRVEIFEKTSEYAPVIMFWMLFIGFVFLIFNQQRLMYISLLATAFIAFYLKLSSNNNLILPQHNLLPKIKVAHFNLSSINQENAEFETILNEIDADVISFQEFTPAWAKPLSNMLIYSYPYSHKIMRADPFGMIIFSKKPFINISTFTYESIPNLIVTINNEMQNIDIISSYVPLFYSLPQLNRAHHLATITKNIEKCNNPLIVLGDYSKVYWHGEMIQFRNESKLNNSRRSTALSSPNPYDHIFFTDALECIQFDEITDSNENHIGITGTYQINSKINYNHNYSLGN